MMASFLRTAHIHDEEPRENDGTQEEPSAQKGAKKCGRQSYVQDTWKYAHA